MTVLPLLSVNCDRLNRSLFQLAEIGKLPNDGVCRLAFSTEDMLARQLVQSWMVEAGMTVRTDAAGNIIGRYGGHSEQAAALATGSHIDTVPVAGRYDGCLGVLAGIEMVRTLNENHMRLHHPIEVIVFTDEERSVIGAKAMAGEIKEGPHYYARLDGTSIQTCLEKIGGDWSTIATAKRDRTQVAAFVELHVEQGGVLEYHGTTIGVVDGIVGQYRFAVTVMGRMNHAGTTPMNLRKDALVAAAQVILAINKIAVHTPGDQVATVGFIEASPNATNTVAGKVDLRIDLRDLSQEHLDYLVTLMKQEFEAIATATGTQITMRETLHILPTLAACPIKNTIQQVCECAGFSYLLLPSRAGHDAQEMGRFTDMGMIFVPSKDGLSHSQDEYTAPEDCARGADILLQTFLALDEAYATQLGKGDR
jgi:beta-ureidopropionase / N-carbamoyl-L-amino-acid hydrolase